MRQVEIIARALAVAEKGDASAWRLYTSEARLAVGALRVARRHAERGTSLN